MSKGCWAYEPEFASSHPAVLNCGVFLPPRGHVTTSGDIFDAPMLLTSVG